MTALKEQWQQAREQRQAELQQRRDRLMEQLAEMTANRQASAIATATDLQTYVAELQSEVAQTRLKNQQDLAELRSEVLAMAADVQATLIEICQDRQDWSAVLMDKLASDADALRETVQQFLVETAEIRQERTAALRAHLASERQAQVDDVAAFRQSLRTSLAALTVFRQALRESVWGDAPLDPTETAAREHAEVATPKPQAKTSPKSTAPKPDSPKPQSTAQAKAQALSALKTPLTRIEQTILDYLKETDGLKVIEIEQALLLQRLQTIDALRVLQQRGLVVQKERHYYAA